LFGSRKKQLEWREGRDTLSKSKKKKPVYRGSREGKWLDGDLRAAGNYGERKEENLDLGE